MKLSERARSIFWRALWVVLHGAAILGFAVPDLRDWSTWPATTWQVVFWSLFGCWLTYTQGRKDEDKRWAAISRRHALSYDNLVNEQRLTIQVLHATATQQQQQLVAHGVPAEPVPELPEVLK